MVEWYVLSLISAVFSAGAAISQKKILFKESALGFSLLVALFNLILAIPFFFFVEYTTLTTSGILVLFLKSTLGAIAFLFVMLGIKNLEISEALPLLVLAPGLVAIFAFIFLGENINKIEILGLILLIIGTYLLSLKEKQKIKTPFKKAFSKKGHYYIIFALIIFTITSILDKAVLNKFKIPLNAFMGLQHLFFAIVFIGLLFVTGKKIEFKSALKNSWAWIALVALFTITYRYTHLLAIKSTSVALALSIKRISVFLAVAVGGALFKDKNLIRKIIATVIIIAGALLIINGQNWL
ncbi:MAG: EamA family transporter [Nanoarchaeota archaeon]|nr:EamA family transporter [Nanoarchaeota archaeon]